MIMVIPKQHLIFTRKFLKPNLIGIFSGHIHQNSIEIIKGKPQIVSDDNASGGYLELKSIPLEPLVFSLNNLNKDLLIK